jgi:hypothetical protein
MQLESEHEHRSEYLVDLQPRRTASLEATDPLSRDPDLVGEVFLGQVRTDAATAHRSAHLLGRQNSHGAASFSSQ